MMSINKKKITPVILVSIFFLMLGLSFAAVPLYDLFCRITGFGGTTQNASNKEVPKIVVNQNYKMRFDTNINSTLDWNFTPEIKTLNLKPGEVHTVKFYDEKFDINGKYYLCILYFSEFSESWFQLYNLILVSYFSGGSS